MPIDPSIPLQGTPPQSPLAGLAQPIQTAQGLLQLKQNSMQLNANQAISNAYAQSVDPATGQVDFNKLQTLASQNGAGAFLPQFMGQIAQQRNSQQQYDTAKLDMALKQQQNLRGMIGSLAVDPDLGKVDMSPKIAGQISNAVSAGTLPLDRAVQEIQQIPSDPDAQANWIQNHLINSLSGEAKLTALMPKTNIVNTGGQTQVVNTNPLTGAPTIAGSLANTMAPGEAASPVQLASPNGTPYATTKGNFAAMAGGAQPGGYTGRYNPAGAAPGAAPAGGANGVPAGGLQTGLSPADQASQTAAATTQATASTTAAQHLHDAAADAPMRVNLLNTARDALSNITTGPGTDWRNTIASALQSTPALGTALKAMGVNDPSSIQNYDEYKKILTNYASSVSGSLGTGTDARLNAAVTGNANPGISNLANEDILVKTLAAEKMRAAQDYAFQNSGLTGDKFNQWQSQWNKSVSPDAFAFAEMNPTQQQSFIQRQTKAGTLGQFKSNLGNLVRSGVITMPGQGGQ